MRSSLANHRAALVWMGIALSLAGDLLFIQIKIQLILKYAPGDADTIHRSFDRFTMPLLSVWSLNFILIPTAVIGMATDRQSRWIRICTLFIHVAVVLGPCIVYPL